MADRPTATILAFRPRDSQGKLPPTGTSEALDEAIGRVTELRVKAAEARANGTTLLVAPGCEIGCDSCVRECAIQRIMLRWWEGELTSLMGGGVLTHDGVAYAEPAGRA